MITDRLIDGIIAMQNPTCVGLDTLFDYLPDDMKAGAKTFEDVAARVLEFNKKIIDNIYDIVPSVKVQIADVLRNAEIRGGKGFGGDCGRKAQRYRFNGVLLCKGVLGKNRCQ